MKTNMSAKPPAAMDATPHMRKACADDLPTIINFLAEAQLPTADLCREWPGTFFLAERGGACVGVAGLEGLGACALIRSLAVAPAWRGRGLAASLLAECEALARQTAIGQLYLLTSTAADYFRRRAYVEVARSAVPAIVAEHAQFRSLCPASAKCLAKTLA